MWADSTAESRSSRALQGRGLATALRGSCGARGRFCGHSTSRARKSSGATLKKVAERTSALPCDVSKGAEVRSAVEKVVEAHGHLDVRVNSAGVGLIRSMAEASEEEFDRLAAIDLWGIWLRCKDESLTQKPEERSRCQRRFHAQSRYHAAVRSLGGDDGKVSSRELSLSSGGIHENAGS